MGLRVRKPDGWATVELPDNVDEVTVASGQTDGQFSLTLIGIRGGTENVYVKDVLDVDSDDEAKLSSELPRIDDGNEPAAGPARARVTRRYFQGGRRESAVQ